MRIHLLSLPHTITRDEFTHCAYTGKVLRFSPMMRSVGFEVIHYGVAGARSGANEQVDLMSQDEQEALLGYKHMEHIKGQKFVGDAGNTSNPSYIEFNKRLAPEIKSRYQPGDFVALPFGYSSNMALQEAGIPYERWVETGVGYLEVTAHWVIFESYCMMHYFLGTKKIEGDDYKWVIPNYFNIDEWSPNYDKNGYVLYFGRLNDIKGLPIVVEMAKQRPDLHFVICGQGDPKPYLVANNIEYRPPIYGPYRSALYEGARAVVMPTRYVEPFGGVNVEAQLCGKPVLASNFGVFNETIEDGATGFLCNTLGDYLRGLELIEELDGSYIRQRAVEKYDMYRLAHKYRNVFEQINDVLTDKGWYSRRSRLQVKKQSVFKPAVNINVKPKKKFVWYSAVPGWSIESQEGIIKDYLDKQGEEVIQLDWADSYTHEQIEPYIKEKAVFVTPNTGLQGLVSFYQVPPEQIINIQYDDYSLAWTLYRFGIQSGRQIFNRLHKFAVFSPSVINTAAAFGIQKIPTLLPPGLFIDKYTYKERTIINNLGYAQVFQRHIFTDTEFQVPELFDVKRGNLAELVAQSVNLPILWATGPQLEEGRGVKDPNYKPVPGIAGGTEMNTWYQEVDLLLVPSILEGGPLAPFEAAACGIPTIGTRVGSFYEFAAAGSGILVDHTNFVEESINWIKDLQKNPAVYQELCKRARINVHKHDWSQVLPKWLTLFTN